MRMKRIQHDYGPQHEHRHGYPDRKLLCQPNYSRVPMVEKRFLVTNCVDGMFPATRPTRNTFRYEMGLS